MSKIAEILRAYPADCQPTEVEFLGSAGGLSGAEFWRLVAPRGALGLRRWPMEHPTPERLGFIHAVLQHAASHGIDNVPVPIATTRGDTFVQRAGRLWELTPWLPGAADYEISPSLDKLRAAMVALAKFHLAVADFPVATRFGPAPAVTQRLERLHELQIGGIATLVNSVDDGSWPELTSMARKFAGMLPHVVPATIAQLEPLANVPLPLQVCIRDVWSDSFLFTGDVVTGLVDFGATDFDTPAADVARLLGSLVGDDATAQQTGLTAYSSICPLTDAEWRAIPAINRAGITLAGCNWLRWTYVEHRKFESLDQIVDRLRRIINRLAEPCRN